MSFRSIPIIKKIFTRKEKDSLQTHSYPKTNHLRKERASSFTSKGSITLEAAVVIPIFFLAVICMVYLFEVMAVQTSVRSALQSVGREFAEEVYAAPITSASRLEAELVERIGKEKLDNSIVANGSDGLSCKYSNSSPTTAVMNLNVRYQIEIPVLMFKIPIRTYEERLRVKGWTGYVAGSGNSAEDDTVYVTDYGLVYHSSLTCSYLELSIRGVAAKAIGAERNHSGGIYHPCESCDDVAAGNVVYITDYGSRYHTSLDCSGLKRNVYVVLRSEVNGLGGCSKCVY